MSTSAAHVITHGGTARAHSVAIIADAATDAAAATSIGGPRSSDDPLVPKLARSAHFRSFGADNGNFAGSR